MSIVEREPSTAAARPKNKFHRPKWLKQPKPRVAPIELVKLCYTMVHAAEAVGIRDLADGEYLPGDTTLEQGIERQLNYLLDQVGCTRPGFRLLEIGCGYGHLQRLAKKRGAHVVGVNLSPEQVKYCNDQGGQVLLLQLPRSSDGERLAWPIRWSDRERVARALGAARRCDRRTA